MPVVSGLMPALEHAPRRPHRAGRTRRPTRRRVIAVVGMTSSTPADPPSSAATYSRAKRTRPSTGSSSRPSWNSKSMLNARWKMPKWRKPATRGGTTRRHGHELLVQAEVDASWVSGGRCRGSPGRWRHPHEHGDVDGDQRVGDEGRLAGAPVAGPGAGVRAARAGAVDALAADVGLTRHSVHAGRPQRRAAPARLPVGVAVAGRRGAAAAAGWGSSTSTSLRAGRCR